MRLLRDGSRRIPLMICTLGLCLAGLGSAGGPALAASHTHGVLVATATPKPTATTAGSTNPGPGASHAVPTPTRVTYTSPGSSQVSGGTSPGLPTTGGASGNSAGPDLPLLPLGVAITGLGLVLLRRRR